MVCPPLPTRILSCLSAMLMVFFVLIKSVIRSLAIFTSSGFPEMITCPLLILPLVLILWIKAFVLSCMALILDPRSPTKLINSLVLSVILILTSSLRSPLGLFRPSCLWLLFLQLLLLSLLLLLLDFPQLSLSFFWLLLLQLLPLLLSFLLLLLDFLRLSLLLLLLDLSMPRLLLLLLLLLS